MIFQDIEFMREALGCAEQALLEGEVPVGAVLVLDGAIVGRGWNRGRITHDPTAHAEMMAIRTAAAGKENYRLEKAILYVTLEPCFMCFGAMLEGRISRLVYATREPRRGVLGSLYDLHNDPRLHHHMDVASGILEVESQRLLKDYFAKKREEGSKESFSELLRSSSLGER